LRTPKSPPLEYLAITLANELAELPDKLLMVLDDFHLIEGEMVPELVTDLLDFLPPQVCLVIATRQDPNLPLIRLRANGECSELRMADLRFAPDEAKEFLQQAVAIGLNDEIIKTLDERTEGWIAGDVITAARLVEQNYRQVVNAEQWARLRRWMERLPESVIMQRPGLLMARCWLAAVRQRVCGRQRLCWTSCLNSRKPHTIPGGKSKFSLYRP
jgi:LuxR family maltose regulon positive regulatory protein